MLPWKDIEDALVSAGEGTLSEAAQLYPNERFYGLVIEIPQNWAFEIHLNSEVGLSEGVGIFRKGSVGYEKKSDSEIAEMLGRWYFQAWKYSYLSMKLDSSLSSLNIENYSILEEACNDSGGDVVRSGFLACASRAAQRIICGSAISRLPRTDGFSARVADEDGLDFYTHERIK